MVSAESGELVLLINLERMCSLCHTNSAPHKCASDLEAELAIHVKLTMDPMIERVKTLNGVGKIGINLLQWVF